MDIEHEAGRLHDATSLLGRMRRKRELGWTGAPPYGGAVALATL
jgi:hypothetical protein